MNFETLLLVVTGLLTSLLVGVFFGYSTSVVLALRRLPSREYVRTMQIINQVILNPLFLLTFMAPVVLLPLVTFMYSSFGSTEFWLLASASAFYILGTFGITTAGNVPLNDRLSRVQLDTAGDDELERARTAFEQPWNRLHNIRTAAGVVAVALFFAACVLA